MYLNCKSWFSFHYGTYKTEDLVIKAAELGITALALTNINNTCDAWDFVDFCNQNQVKPVLGSEIRNEHEFMYILLARNNIGFEKINRFLSHHFQSGIEFPLKPDLSEDIYIIYPFHADRLASLKEHEFMGVQTIELNKLFGADLKKYSSRLLIRHPVTYQDNKHYSVHRLLRAIDKNILLSKQDKKDLAGKHEKFLSPNELLQAFRQYSFLVTNSLRLLDNCSIEMEFHKDKTKKNYSASSADDKIFLEKLAMDGLHKRYGTNKVASQRVRKELDIIDRLGFNAYFLISWDIIRYARNRGFYYVGRGSGANSIVAYCLQITDVDPIELDLYFERFMNPYRATPPDFDIDFSWKDRDEMIDYIFKRYGREHVCLLGSYTTFQARALIRELGKVFGLPKEEIDALEGSEMKDDKIQKQILHFGSLMKNFPDHLSIHAGGILICDRPLYHYTAAEMPPKGFATSQIDMFLAEKIGLFKLDILSQRGLGHIKETLELVSVNQHINIDIHDIEKFKKDENLASQIRTANTIGCFYIESPGMRQLLKKLECDDYITLVAASSIIRPGVAQSGMMKQYIYRFHHPDSFEYLHPKMKELLEETYGVMVYQEDVIKVAHHFGKLDMGEADVLRRAMSGKYRGHKHFELIREKYFANCKREGYPDHISVEVWRQIESFGGYSFSKAHSASFAVESYQSLYLKTYFPREFMVAVINNFGGFYSRELYFHELKKTGAHIHPPCLNESHYLTSIKGSEVYMGFIHVQGLEELFMQRVIEERNKNGNYLHLQDFIERLNPGLEQLNILIRIGAFRFSGKSKKELLWHANFLQKKNMAHAVATSLFKEEPFAFSLPGLPSHPLDDAMDEIELLGFPLSDVFQIADDDLSCYIPASSLHEHLGKEVSVIGYLITTKPVQTIKRETMYFHTFIDASGDWLDTIFFPPTAKKYPVHGKGFYSMKGRVVEDFGVFSVEVSFCKSIGIKSRNGSGNL